MNNKKIKFIIIAAILFILFIGYRLSNRAAISTNNQLSLDEIEYIAVRDNISVSIKGTGSVYPSDKRIVKSEIDGTVEKIYVSEGDKIENNEMLISLKSKSNNNNQLQAKEISLNIEKARKALNELYDKNNDLNIYADFSGVISGFNLNVGDRINANSNILSIKDTNHSYVDAYFNKDQYDKINIGDEASVFLSKYFATEKGTVYHIDSTPIPLGGGAIGYRITIKINNPGGYSQGDSAQVTVTNSEGSLVNMINGKVIEAKENRVISTKGGKIKTINIKNGMQVNKGDIILELEEEDIEIQIAEQRNLIEKYQAQLNDLNEGDTLYSPMKGTVLAISVSDEEVVGRSSALMTIADLDKMEVVLEVDELDITKVKLGQEAYITSDVFKDESFSGSVSKISLEGKNQNGVTTYDVTVQINDRKSLMAGMNVDVEILAANKSDVIILPVEAVHKINGNYMTTVRDESGNLSDIDVKLGIANINYVEIISGISEGDVIVYTKIQNKSSNMFNGGIMRFGR